MKQKMPLLNYRHKTIIDLVKAFDGRIPATDFQKYLFLFTKEVEQKPSFEFVPYQYGCFSFQSQHDKRHLMQAGILSDEEDWAFTSDYSSQKNLHDSFLRRFYDQYAHLRGKELIRHVYRCYPYYAINSRIYNKLMTEKEIVTIKEAKPRDCSPCLFTIGYEGSSFDHYLNRLIKNNIHLLVDVRSHPFSRKYGFSKKTLVDTLNKLNIDYLHIPTLGIPFEERSDLHTQEDYDRLFDSYETHVLQKHRDSLKTLFDIFVTKQRIALTCFESAHTMCHRGRLTSILSRQLVWKYYSISHI
jgi:uncharacterized protein (DUF488 family)